MQGEGRYYALKCLKSIGDDELMKRFATVAPLTFCKSFVSQTSFQLIFIGFHTAVPFNIVNNTALMHIHTQIDVKIIEEKNQIKPANEIYLFNLPEAINHSHSVQALINIFDENATIKHPPGLFVVSPSNEENSILLQTFLPDIDFGNDSHLNMVVDDAYQVPYLLIQNLPVGTTKDKLIQFFYTNDFQVNFLEIIPNTKLNNMTAEVIFPSNQIADQFTEKMNYTQYETNTIFIRHYLSPKQLEEMKKWRIKALGIKRNMSLREVNEIFSKYGEIFSITIRDATGVIEYRDFQSAEKAILGPPKGFTLSYLVMENAKMICLNMPINTTEADITKIFPNAFGIKIISSKYEGVRPIIHIIFKSKDEMKSAIETGNKISADGMRLICLRFNEFHSKIGEIQASMTKNNSVFVINLPQGFLVENIVQILKQYGDILYIKYSSANATKHGFAGVLFAEISSVPKVLASSNEAGGLSIKQFCPK